MLGSVNVYLFWLPDSPSGYAQRPQLKKDTRSPPSGEKENIMIIGIDLRCLPADGSSGAGVAHAAHEMARALISSVSPDVGWVLYLPRGAAFDAADAPNYRRVLLADVSGASFRKALHDAPCDIALILSGSVPPKMPVPAIPWVHDVKIFEHPEWFGQSYLRRMVTTKLFRLGIARAPRILAISQDTKDELVRLFGLDPSTIDVTYEGGDTFLSELHGPTLHEAKQRAKLRLADRGVTNQFILALGTVQPRKNLPMLISAWQELVPLMDHPVDLVIAGTDGWKLHHFARALREVTFKAEGPSRLHRINAVSDDDRRDLLLAADVVAVPSLHEGFGLVALEAMEAETAVIASDAGALPEVLQDAGLLLPPTDRAAWVKALKGVLSDDEARRHMAELGKARSQGLTWGRAAFIALQSLTKTTG